MSEMRKLRRDLFLLVAKDAAHPGPVSELFHRNLEYVEPGENLTEIDALMYRASQDAYAGRMRKMGVKSPSANATPEPRPILPKTPTYAKHPAFKVTRRWTPKRTPHGPGDNFVISTPAFDAADNVLWLFGEIRSFTPPRLVHSSLFEISLPSLATSSWDLPDFELEPGDDNGFFPDAIHILRQGHFLYIAKGGLFLAIGNRQTREWKLVREVRPFGGFAHVGDELFFLTRSGGARGMAAVSLRDQSIAVVASNRRTPMETPLDRPDLTAVSLQASAPGIVEIITEPFDSTDVSIQASSEPKPRSLFGFTPSSKTWSGPRPIVESGVDPRTFTPLVSPGVPKAYKKNPNLNVWTLQLPRTEMPKARIPFEFIAADDGRPATEYYNADFSDTRWFWAPPGYIVMVARRTKDPLIYFIPQAELDAYLDAHVPEEDESTVHAPAPTKP